MEFLDPYWKSEDKMILDGSPQHDFCKFRFPPNSNDSKGKKFTKDEEIRM